MRGAGNWQRRLSLVMGGLLILVGLVAFRPQPNYAVSEWELMAPPASVQGPSVEFLGATAARNPTNNRSFAWAVGQHMNDPSTALDDLGVALTYNGTRWVPQVFQTNFRLLEAVQSWTEDRGSAGPSSDDVHRVWAAGESHFPARGWLVYEETYPSGNSSGWDTAIIRNPASAGSDPITFIEDPSQAGDEPWPFNDLDLFDRSTGLVAGENPARHQYPVGPSVVEPLAYLCNLWRTTDSGVTWRRPTTPPPASDDRPNPPNNACRHITNVRFARNFDDNAGRPDPVGNRPRRDLAWLTYFNNANTGGFAGNADQVWFSLDRGDTWRFFANAGGNDAQNEDWRDLEVVFFQGRYHLWLIGADRDEPYFRYLSCTEPGPPVVSTDCDQLSPATTFADVLPQITPHFPGPQPRLNDLTITIDTKNDADPANNTLQAWLALGTRLGTDGAILFTEDLLASTGVVWRKESVASPQPVFGISAINPGHAFAVGGQAALLKLSPGNLTGWGWIGADSCDLICNPRTDPGCINTCPGGSRDDPLGWMSLNCANRPECLVKDFGYGLTLRLKREKNYCSLNPSLSCTSDATCAAVGAGTCLIAQCTDTDQEPDVGSLTGHAWVGKDDPQQFAPGLPICSTDPASCRPVGWVSFDRVRTCSNDATRTCRTNTDCVSPGTCTTLAPLPGPPFNSFPSPFTTACQKTIANASPQNYLMSGFDYANDRVEGWAKFLSPDLAGSGWVKLRGPYRCGAAWCATNRSSPGGQCRNADGSPGPAACSGSCDTDQLGAAPAGGCAVASASFPQQYYSQCDDCAPETGDPANPADDRLRCKICTHLQTVDWWSAQGVNLAFFQARQRLRVTAPAGQDIFQHHTLSYVVNVDGTFGGSFPFNNLRIVYHSANSFAELDREIIRLDDGTEEIRFRAFRDIPRGQSNESYYLYFAPLGTPTPAPTDPARIYEYYQNFSDPTLLSSGAWQRRPSTCAFSIVSGRLQYSTTSAGDCYAFDRSQTSLTRHLNLETTINVGGDDDFGSIGFFSDRLGTLAASVWSGLDDNGNNNRLFIRDNDSPTYGPHFGSTSITPGTNYRYQLHSEFPVGGGRRYRGYFGPLSGDFDAPAGPTLIPPDDTHDVLPVTGSLGVHSNDSTTTWDDLKAWQGLPGVTFSLLPLESFSLIAGDPYPAGLTSTRGPLELWSCNQCGTALAGGEATSCGIGQCLPTAPANARNVCLNDSQCGGAAGSCRPVGHCANDGRTCWSSGDCTGGFSCVDVGQNVCNQCQACNLYGVSLDPNGGAIHGFGFSQDFGYIDFSQAFLYNRAWLQVLNGSIYSAGDVGSTRSGPPPRLAGVPALVPGEECNATYAIRSGGTIINFCSLRQTTPATTEPGSSPYLRPEFDQLTIPKTETQFRSPAGNLNLNQILDDLDDDRHSGGRIDEDNNLRNAQGQIVFDVAYWLDPSVDTYSELRGRLAGLNDIPYCLGNTIFYIARAFTFDQYDPDGPVGPLSPQPPIFTDPGSTSVAGCPSGAGTFVVEGDVTINTNMQYQTGSVANIRETPALGIIAVRRNAGDPPPIITIDETVGGRDSITGQPVGTVGNFFTEGRIIIEGTRLVNAPDLPYRNDGVMVAGSFDFQRRYRGESVTDPRPAEQIVNDGRLTINPPPGFESFASVLPRISEARP